MKKNENLFPALAALKRKSTERANQAAAYAGRSQDDIEIDRALRDRAIKGGIGAVNAWAKPVTLPALAALGYSGKRMSYDPIKARLSDDGKELDQVRRR